MAGIEIKITDDPIGHMARLYMRVAEKAIAERSQFTVALSGGSTPVALYERFIRDYPAASVWPSSSFFWSDERMVPLHHKDSNAGTAIRTLLAPIGQPEDRYFPPRTDLPPQACAKRYEAEIKKHFSNRDPCFDLIMLGLGPDGHTASLFPQTDALDSHSRLVRENWVQKLEAWRITFTFSLINQARLICFLVTGKEKAEIVQAVLSDAAAEYPASRVRSEKGTVLWLLDAEAGSLLKVKGGSYGTL